MNDKMQQFLETLIPYLIFGVMIAIFLGLLYIFSYLLVWGIIIGAIVWGVATAKNYFYPKDPEKKGRVIDHK